MNDDANLFEIVLSKLDASPQVAARSPGQPESSGSALRDELRLVCSMRQIQVSESELSEARMRVTGRLWDEMAVSPAASLPFDKTPTRIRPTRRGAHQRSRVPRCVARAALTAAILLVGCFAGWQVSAAAAAALPESPLYGIKRGEELLALNTSWSDSRRGEVLATIADHRLSELRAESLQQKDPLVHSLAAELDGTMRQLISLTASMTARHENLSSVSADLAHEMNAEYATLDTALQSGDVALAQVLAVTTQSEATMIYNSHINLPSSSTNTAIPPWASPGTPGIPTSSPGGSGTAPGHNKPPQGPANGTSNGNHGAGNPDNPGNGGRGKGGNADPSDSTSTDAQLRGPTLGGGGHRDV
jgi:hypothetical protein